MITYNWTIQNLEHNVTDGGVIVAHWRVVAEETVGEETYTASAYGTCGFTPDPTAADFIPYADLTEEAVLVWVFNQAESWKTDIEASLAKHVDDQKTPKTANGTPWETV